MTTNAKLLSQLLEEQIEKCINGEINGASLQLDTTVIIARTLIELLYWKESEAE